MITSKEYKQALYVLEHHLASRSEQSREELDKAMRNIFRPVLKDLEELEQYRKVMIPPIRKLMKDLDRLEKLERYLIKWEEQLGIDGVNSKGMVRADIQFLLKED